jgi:hypothetical protein
MIIQYYVLIFKSMGSDICTTLYIHTCMCMCVHNCIWFMIMYVCVNYASFTHSLALHSELRRVQERAVNLIDYFNEKMKKRDIPVEFQWTLSPVWY